MEGGKGFKMSKTEIVLDDLETMANEAENNTVGSLDEVTREDWDNAGYYCGVIKATNAAGDEKEEGVPFIGYDDYLNARAYIAETGGTITGENFKTKAEYFPGLVTYESALEAFENADDRILMLKNFPEFSKTAKIKKHSTVVLAADTGAGKSSLSINFLNDLLDDYPALYINLEMDYLQILQRLVSVRTGLEIDRVEGYKKDPHTAELVKKALQGMAKRKPLQVLNDLYSLDEIEAAIDHATAGREEPTVVIIDHGLLIESTKATTSSAEQFREIAKRLRKISRRCNIVMLVLLQQNRSGKADETERPRNSSLKESGEWENSSTHICFLWWDPVAKCKRLIITKHRGGNVGEFILDYQAKTQIYKENPQASKLKARTTAKTAKKTPREKTREKLKQACETAYLKAGDEAFTLFDVAEAAGVSVTTVKSWFKDHGGATIDGKEITAAGVDDVVEFHGFRDLTPAERNENPLESKPKRII